MSKLLILGGTADARRMTETLHHQLNHQLNQQANRQANQQPSLSLEEPLLYSIAGLVRQPNIDCPIISGGFTQYGGLEKVIRERNITGILNATHPYAAQMSQKANEAAVHCQIPCYRFLRPSWTQRPGDRWHRFDTWQQLLARLPTQRRLFVTVGQLTQDQLNALAETSQQIIYRTAVKPSIELPTNALWLKAIGPFDKISEETLMRQYNINALISKDSGGDAIVAKIDVARQLEIPVYLQNRPNVALPNQCFTDPNTCTQFIVEHFFSRSQHVVQL